MKSAVMKNWAAGLTLVLASSACVSTRFEPGPDHPASAKAETPPLLRTQPLLAASALPPPSPAPSGAAHEHNHGAPLSEQYSCPMHPEVVKNAPGKCPVCGMNLVKKESASPREAGH